MANLSFASSFLLYLLYILSDLYQHETFANKCDEDFFYLPYVQVKKKKNGGDLASLRSSGFLDLRFRNRVVLCMNGPVVMYSDVERLDPEARLTSQNDQSKNTLKSDPGARNPGPDHGITDVDAGEEELRFKKGELLVFNHQCISINKVPSNVLKKMKEDQGRSNPELMPDTQVNGKLVLGIFLIGNKEGHNRPELAWFKGPNFEYIKTKDKTVKDSSFILTSSNVTHCLRLPDGTHMKIGMGNKESENGSHEVCRWSVQEENKAWYAKVFQRGYDGNGVRNGEATFDEGDYEFYDCPDSDTDRTIILTMGNKQEPITHANYTEFDPFSLFNPNVWTPHGYRKDSNGMSGGDERSEDKAISSGVPQEDSVPCSLDPSNPSCLDSGDMDMTTLRDMQNVDPITMNAYEIVVGDCIPLPLFGMDECTGVGDNGNRLLELVLELEPNFVPETPVEPFTEPTDEQKQDFPKYQNLNNNKTLEWKYDLLYLASDIFSHLCMPFRPEMPYSVARVFAWYVYKAHLYGEEMGRVGPPPGAPPDFKPPLSGQFEKLTEKDDPWPILLKELERCSMVAKTENGGKGLKFQWEIGDDTGKWKIPAVDGRETRRKKRAAVNRRPVRKAYEPQTNSRYKRSAFHDEDDQQDHDEIVEEIDAETGEKVLSRQKRAGFYRVNGSVITTKYILPGKSLTPVRSEGTWGYAREAIQEYRKKPDLNDPRADSMKYMDYPENIQHCWNPQEDPANKQIVCSKTEDLFFYEDRAEIEYELNIAIDLWWKIWATVIGYCNKAYHSRKSETFPRLYNAKYEYFFDLIQKEWKFPEDNTDLKVIFSEYLTEESHIWMDACLEASYINSNSQSFRPPRPMSIEEDKKEISNYFEEIPSYLYYRYHPEPSANM